MMLPDDGSRTLRGRPPASGGAIRRARACAAAVAAAAAATTPAFSAAALAAAASPADATARAAPPCLPTVPHPPSPAPWWEKPPPPPDGWKHEAFIAHLPRAPPAVPPSPPSPPPPPAPPIAPPTNYTDLYAGLVAPFDLDSHQSRYETLAKLLSLKMLAAVVALLMLGMACTRLYRWCGAPPLPVLARAHPARATCGREAAASAIGSAAPAAAAADRSEGTQRVSL